jgi:hypothetical protein
VARSWKDENFEIKSDEELLTLLNNARRIKPNDARKQESEELEKLCMHEITKRDLKARRVPRDTRSTDPVKKLEFQVAEQLAGIYEKTYEIYDLSNNLHDHFAKNGMSKVGGGHQKGRCSIDRYISYKVGEDVISLNADLAKGAYCIILDLSRFGLCVG